MGRIRARAPGKPTEATKTKKRPVGPRLGAAPDSRAQVDRRADLRVSTCLWAVYGDSYTLLRITEIPHCRSPKFPRQPDGVEGLI